MNADAVTERTNELLVRFNLTTAAVQLAGRLEQAGHQQALSIVLEVLEMEAEARQQRKIGRLRRASQLPPGKTFDTLELGLFQPALGRKLRELAGGEFLDNATNLLAFAPPDPATQCPPCYEPDFIRFNCDAGAVRGTLPPALIASTACLTVSFDRIAGSIAHGA